MLADAPYATLVASLPALGPMLAAREPPINPDRFRARLGMLVERDRETLLSVTGLLAWRRMPMGLSDAALLDRAEAVLARLESPTLAELVRLRLGLRTLVAALRRRQAGHAAPRRGERWGLRPLADRVAAAWDAPHFRMERGQPWLVPAKTALEAGDAVGLERILLERAWTQAARLAARHDFDFEAVALYAVRLDLLTRWTRYDAEAAAARFAALVADGLAEPEERPR